MPQSTSVMYDADIEEQEKVLHVYFLFNEKNPVAITFAVNKQEALNTFHREYPEARKEDLSEQWISENRIYRFKNA